MNEIWKEINGYNGIYSVSNYGNVRNNIKNKLSKCTINAGGYSVVTLTKDKKQKVYRVHRLVAEAFIPKIIGKDIINHIDGVKTNNNVNNLEWCTVKENTIHAYNTGLITFSDETRKKMSISHRGEKNINYGKPLTEERKQKMREARRMQKPINPKKVICLNTLQVFDTIKEAGIFYGIKSHNHIVSCCKHKRKYCGEHPDTKEKMQWMYYEEYIQNKNNL